MLFKNISLIIIDLAYHIFIKQILFLFDPEFAQKIIGRLLNLSFIPWKSVGYLLNVEDGKLFTPYFGFYISNPVGLAAGFDKDSDYLPATTNFGFGYITVGTVTVKKQSGNEKPRLYRLRKDSSLINSLGFPSIGIDDFIINLKKYKEYAKTTFLTISITGVSIEQIVDSYKLLNPYCDAIEINISSPNTNQLKIFHDKKQLLNLLNEVNKYKTTPIIIKLPPYLTSQINDTSHLLDEKENILTLVEQCLNSKVDGFTISNSRPISTKKLKTGKGGITGKVLYEGTLEMVQDLRLFIGKEPVINACGGIANGSQAWDLINCGATTVQLYTSLIYSGITIPNKINKYLLKKLQHHDVNNFVDFMKND